MSFLENSRFFQFLQKIANFQNLRFSLLLNEDIEISVVADVLRVEPGFQFLDASLSYPLNFTGEREKVEKTSFKTRQIGPMA